MRISYFSINVSYRKSQHFIREEFVCGVVSKIRGGGQGLGKFLCQNHPTKSDVTFSWKLSWTLVSLETKDGFARLVIFSSIFWTDSFRNCMLWPFKMLLRYWFNVSCKIFSKERSLLLFWLKLPESYASRNGENYIVSKPVAFRLLALAVPDSMKTDITIAYPGVKACFPGFLTFLRGVYFLLTGNTKASDLKALLEQ